MKIYSRDSKNEKALISAITKKYNYLKSVRAISDDKRILAAKLVSHRNTGEAGSIWTNDYPILNTLPKKAIKTSINGIMGHVMSPSLAWFRFNSINKKFYPTDRLYGANDYLEKCQQFLLFIFSQTSFYSAVKMAISDAFIIGTGYLMTVDDQDKNKIHYRCIDPQNMYIGEDDNNYVDTVFKEFSMTTSQAVKAFGDKLPKSILQDFKKGVNSDVKFLDCIYPEGSIFNATTREKIVVTNKKYAHIIYCFKENVIISESGYDEIPYSIFRYNRETTKHPYGISIIMDLIPDILRLFDFCRIQESGAQQQGDPTMFMPYSWQEGNGIDRTPGATNYVRMDNGQPYSVNANIRLNEIDNNIAKLEDYVYEATNAKLFDILMRSANIQQTATWVNEIKGESLVLMASIMDTMQEELIAPVVGRTYSILRRSGMIPPMPDDLKATSENGQIRIELEGPLIKRMRSYMEANGIIHGLQFVGSVLQMNPNASVNIDWDEMLRQGAMAQGLPQTIIKEYADVQKIKKQQLEQAQQQQKQQALLEASQIAKNTNGNTAMLQNLEANANAV